MFSKTSGGTRLNGGSRWNPRTNLINANASTPTESFSLYFLCSLTSCCMLVVWHNTHEGGDKLWRLDLNVCISVLQKKPYRVSN